LGRERERNKKAVKQKRPIKVHCNIYICSLKKTKSRFQHNFLSFFALFLRGKNKKERRRGEEKKRERKRL
jgi:hypothetical protein